MATIKQIVDFMNENKITWHPTDVVQVEYDPRKLPGYEGYESGRIKGRVTEIYAKHDCQRYIGHYYVLNEEGSFINGVMLLPLSTGKYLKANFNIAV